MENLLIFVPFLIPIIVANFGERYRLSRDVAHDMAHDPRTGGAKDMALRYGPFALLVITNLAVLGFAGIALLNQVAVMFMPEIAEQQPALVSNWWGLAIASFLTGILAFLPLFAPIRRWLARFLPIDPESIVHTTALVYAIYQIGLSLGQIALIGELENLISAELALDIWDVLLTGLPLVLVGLAGVGLLIRRDGRGTLARLGLQWLTWKQLLFVVGATALLLGFDYVVNLAWEELDPAGYDLLDRVTQNLFGNLMTVGGALALGLSAGISEEILFRGAVQPRLGILLATVLFTIGHLQYGLSVATLEVFFIGLVLGLTRKWTHTTVCILIHAGYNAVGVLLGLLQP